MPASIFNGTAVKILKNILRTKYGTEVITGDSDDPSSVAKTAPIGSLYIKSDDGRLYQKQDGGSSTNWSLIDLRQEDVFDGGLNVMDFHLGDKDTNGTIRLTNDSGTLKIYTRESGSYVLKGEI